jgi:hypothetical protein
MPGGLNPGAYGSPGTSLGGVTSPSGLGGVVPIPDLDDLPDVNAPSPSNGDVLTWDSTPGEWVALPPGSGSLPWYDLVNDFGAVCDNATDDLTAWQDAVDTMAAAGGGICLVPGMSEISASIVMPDVDYADAEAITIGFVGTFPPPSVPSVIGATPLTDNGPGVRTTHASGTCFSGTGSGLDSFTNVNLLLYNLVVRSPANPTGHCIDALKFANVDFENVQVDASSLDVAGISLQSTATSFGIRLPRVNNGAKIRAKDVNVIGFYNGIQVSEHADLDGVFVWGSRQPWVFEGSYHANHLTRCGWYHCIQGVEFVAGPYTDESYFTWTHCNIERANSGTWEQTGDDIVDPSDFGFGRIEWHAVRASVGVVNTFTKDSGANVWDLEIGDDPFGGGATALDDLTDVAITAVAADDTLRYRGGEWVNDNRRWEAVTDGEDVFVWESDDLVHEWKEY